MEERARHELGVGAVFTFGVILLGSFAYFASYYGRIMRTNTYTLVFDEVAGVEVGGDVLLAGTRAGEVLSVEVQTNGKVFVKIGVSKKHVLRDNYTYTIRSGFLLGNPAVTIHTAPERGEVIPPGALIEATNPARPEDVIADVREALQDAGESLEEARKLIGDPEIHTALRATFRNLSRASEHAVAMTSSLATSSAKVGSEAEGVLRDLRTTARNLAAASGSVENLASNPGLSRDILEMARSLQRASENVEKLTSKPELAQAVENLGALTQDLKQTARALSELLISGQGLAKVAQTLTSAEQAAERVNMIAGEVEAILGSPEVSSGIRETLSNARAASAKALEAAERANSLLSAGERLIRPASTLQATSRTDLYVLSEADRLQTDLELRLGSPWFSRSLALGAQDIGQAAKVNLKVGLSEDRNPRLLGGIHRSTLGIGWESDVSNRLGLAIDLYDPNRLQADLWATYRLSPGLYLGAGAVGLGEENYFRYGIAVRK